MPTSPEQLENLIYTAPDPDADRAALLLLAGPTNKPVRRLAERLHIRADWRSSPLGKLLPGLAILHSPLLAARVGARAAAGLNRADVLTWAALARMAPADMLVLDGMGRGAVEDVLSAALKEWSIAYLVSAGHPISTPRLEEVHDLLGRSPDPETDRRSLEKLRNVEDPDTRSVVEQLHESDLRNQTLRELLPGLGLVESPRFSVRLSVRAANALMRAGAHSLKALASLTPEAILALPEVGLKTGEEILFAALDEWAASYLASAEDQPPEERPPDSSVIAATDLVVAFSEVEDLSGFAAFRRRKLEPDKSTQGEVAGELGITSARVAQDERSIRLRLSKRLRDAEWPIAQAVDELKKRLGSVALVSELDRTFLAIDRSGMVLASEQAHRRLLLLILADYRISGQWVLGTDIETITRGILNGLTEREPADLDSVRQHLLKLEIRGQIQLPWILNQPGFRIVDETIVRIGGA